MQVVEEQAQLAWAWSRVCADRLERMLGGPLRRRLELAEDEVLFVHISPGDAGAWKDRLLGSAIAAAMASLMTGAAAREGLLPDVGVLGELLTPGGQLGGWLVSNPSSLEPYLRSIREVQGIRRVVLAASSPASAAGEQLAAAATTAGVELLPIKTLMDGMRALLRLPASSSASGAPRPAP